MEINCDKLSGLRRAICRGVDDDGNPVDMTAERRQQYLTRWFGGQAVVPLKPIKWDGEPVVLPAKPSDRSCGVGTELKRLLQKKYGIRSSATCQCNYRAAEMDRNGIAWCEANQETLVGWLIEGAAERIWLRPLVKMFNTQTKLAAERLVEEAIESAKGQDPMAVVMVEWREPVRKNLLFHVWPVPGRWRYHLDRILASIDQFNGKRILGIATDGSADPADAVKDYVSGYGFEFIEKENIPPLREVTTFLPMLEMVESSDHNEVTFYGHAKGARHKNTGTGSTIDLWTDAMYLTVYENWKGASEILQTKAMAGSFKRYGQFKTRGNHRWHYSGTFYWFRNRDVFQRNWRKVDQMFFGTESWPGLLFKKEEAGCLFLDNAADLYNLDYWNRVVKPELEKWNGSVPA